MYSVLPYPFVRAFRQALDWYGMLAPVKRKETDMEQTGTCRHERKYRITAGRCRQPVPERHRRCRGIAEGEAFRRNASPSCTPPLTTAVSVGIMGISCTGGYT